MAEGVSISTAPNLLASTDTSNTTNNNINNHNNHTSNSDNNVNNGDSNSSSASLFDAQSDASSHITDPGDNDNDPEPEVPQPEPEAESNAADFFVAINNVENIVNHDSNEANQEVIDLTDDNQAPPPPHSPIMIDDLDNDDDNELEDFLDLRHTTNSNTTNGNRRRANAAVDRPTRRRQHRLTEQQQQQQQQEPQHPESDSTAGPSSRIIKKRRLSDCETSGGGASASATTSPTQQPADEGCTICFEAWTSAGDHRVCALRCGHLFGKSCVERWLETRQQCPQCNRSTRRHEVVPLYVTNLRAMDNSENEALKLEIEKIRRAKLTAEQEAGDMRLRLDMLREENRRLSRQLEFYRSHSSKLTIDLTDAAGETCSYRLEDNVMISQGGECRVLALNHHLNVLCVSQPSRNPLFRGYGLRKLDLVDFRNSSYIHLHTNKLRDVCFNPEGTLLLTAGMDKQIRLTGFHSEQTVCYFDCPTAVWSCAWSPFDSNQFYAGLANGRVMCFDMRNTSSHVGLLPCAEEPPSVTSVVSLASLSASQTVGTSPAALLSGQFDRLSLYRRSTGSTEASGSGTSAAAAAATTDDAEQHRAAPLPMPGGPAAGQQLAWLTVEPNSRHVLLTHRPTVNHQQPAQQQQQQPHRNGVDHSVCSLDFVSGDEVALRPLSRIRAGLSMKLLARSRLFQQASRSGGALTVAAGDEASCRLNLWDAATGEKLQSLARLPQPVLDIAPVRNGRYLACLTEQSVYVYKDTKAE